MKCKGGESRYSPPTQNKESQMIETPFTIGRKYFIRTVTFHFTGRVKSIVGKFIILEDAAWIADSGRFAGAIQTGNMNEVEPFPSGHDLIVNTDTITDAVEVKFELPREQK